MSTLQKVLIFQIGSLGDTVISMPCYREIVRRHPDSERYLLTNFPIGKKMVQAEALLAPCGLIDGCVEFPMPLRGFRNIKELYRKLRSLKIDIVYYLIPEKRLINVIRHYTFFRACGTKDIRGVPWTRDLRYSRELVPGKLWETEGSRLLRTLDHSRVPGAPEPSDRSLDLTEAERDVAKGIVAEMDLAKRYLAFSVGGKIPVKDWGNENWATVLKMLSASEPELGIVFVGSQDERERNDLLAESWSGPKVNACGRLTRERPQQSSSGRLRSWGTTRARSTWLQRSTHESSVSFAGAMYRVFGIPTDRATTSSTISLRVTDVTLTMSPIASMDLYV